MRSSHSRSISLHRVGSILALSGAALFACLSCERSPRAVIYPVSGRLLVNGQPAGNASIAFHPQTSTTWGRCPVAITRSDGTFHLNTNGCADGAPAGTYKVTIVWHNDSEPVDDCEDPNPIGHDRLRGRFADWRRSPLTIVVRPEANMIPLKVEADGSGVPSPRGA